MKRSNVLWIVALVAGSVAISGCMKLIPALAPGVDAEPSISSDFPYESRYVDVLDSRMHYVEEGDGPPILLLHGNPTSSYLWRNVIPHLSGLGRVVAPDLIGMGKSGKPDLDYHLDDHIRYMDAFIAALELEDVVLVLHDWGGGIGFDWAMRHQDSVRGIAFMEAVMRPSRWADAPLPVRILFGNLRDEERGHELVVEENYFVETLIPMMSGRELSDVEMNTYREPFLDPGHRKPVRVWPQEIPFDGEPARTHARIESNYRKLQAATTPLLLLHAEPGAIFTEAAVAEVQAEIPRLETESIGPGMHYVQESQPTNIGKALHRWIDRLPER